MHPEHYQQTSESNQFRQEFEMRKRRQVGFFIFMSTEWPTNQLVNASCFWFLFMEDTSAKWRNLIPNKEDR